MKLQFCNCHVVSIVEESNNLFCCLSIRLKMEDCAPKSVNLLHPHVKLYHCYRHDSDFVRFCGGNEVTNGIVLSDC